MIKRATIEINIDEDIDKKYPNYKHSFRSKEAFLKFLLEEIVVDNSLFGYTIKLVKNDKMAVTGAKTGNME